MINLIIIFLFQVFFLWAEFQNPFIKRFEIASKQVILRVNYFCSIKLQLFVENPYIVILMNWLDTVRYASLNHRSFPKNVYSFIEPLYPWNQIKNETFHLVKLICMKCICVTFSKILRWNITKYNAKQSQKYVLYIWLLGQRNVH